jgi:hypothetical protein
MDIALGDMILNLSGEVVHTHSTDAGMHVSGVEFDPLDEKTRTLLKEFLRHFDPV